ncbi:hypothetical protein ACFOLD_15745 [Kocuria carniphila]|uniref:hypothetical protein n=1 Tax=Kocuria carniphila TaxID=262208 RepID=UPI003614465F
MHAALCAAGTLTDTSCAPRTLLRPSKGSNDTSGAAHGPNVPSQAHRPMRRWNPHGHLLRPKNPSPPLQGFQRHLRCGARP